MRALDSESGEIISYSENSVLVVHARCKRCGWGQGRTWTYEQTAIQKLAEHQMAAHHIQLRLEADVSLQRGDEFARRMRSGRLRA